MMFIDVPLDPAGIVSGTWMPESTKPDVFVVTEWMTHAVELKLGIPKSSAWLAPVEPLNPSNTIGFTERPQALSGAQMSISLTCMGGTCVSTM